MAGISRVDVFDAAATLVTQGVEPTIARVREQLGSGSNSTITKHLRDWRNEVDPAPRPAIPDLPESVSDLFVDVWKQAVAEARDTAIAELQEHRRQVEEERQNAQTAVQNANEARARVENDNAVLNERLSHFEQAREHASSEAATLRFTLDEANKTHEQVQSEHRDALLKAQADARHAIDERSRIERILSERCETLEQKLVEADGRYEADMAHQINKLDNERQLAGKSNDALNRTRLALAETQSVQRQTQQDLQISEKTRAEDKKKFAEIQQAHEAERQQMIRDLDEARRAAQQAHDAERSTSKRLDQIVASFTEANQRSSALLAELERREEQGPAAGGES